MTTVAGASVGTFTNLNADPNIGPGYDVKGDHVVWAVKFTGDVTICPPAGDCMSPRPGTMVVYLDYATGNFLTSSTVSPAK